MMNEKPSRSLQIILADDDIDDRFFFDMALKTLPIETKLITVNDGQRLMDHLSKNSDNLPDVLFLDLNMPRKNGAECLKEIKNNKDLKKLPVIIYSTSLHENTANELYENGAHYYIRKGSLSELEKNLHNVLTLMINTGFNRPSRDQFILSS